MDRSVLVALLSAYCEKEGKVILKLRPKLAPFKAAVFPLLANKPELAALARKIYLDLKQDFMIAWDDRGNIGKRYASQDEIGTPFCITVDFQSLEDEVDIQKCNQKGVDFVRRRTGGGAVYNDAELEIVASRGISASLIGQILIEESVIGWEELELEGVRDSKANKITVCFI